MIKFLMGGLSSILAVLLVDSFSLLCIRVDEKANVDEMMLKSNKMFERLVCGPFHNNSLVMMQRLLIIILYIKLSFFGSLKVAFYAANDLILFIKFTNEFSNRYFIRIVRLE